MSNVSLLDLDQLEAFLSGGFDGTPVFADNGLQLLADVATTGVDTKSVLSRRDGAQADVCPEAAGSDRAQSGSKPADRRVETGFEPETGRETWNVTDHLARLGADGARKWNVDLRRAMENCVDVKERPRTEAIEGVVGNDIVLQVQMAVPTRAGRNPEIGMGSLRTVPRGIVKADDILICRSVRTDRRCQHGSLTELQRAADIRRSRNSSATISLSRFRQRFRLGPGELQ